LKQKPYINKINNNIK